jgi:hydroxymethylpyrimidine pyrophosphatase-like HAD family hydrolase
VKAAARPGVLAFDLDGTLLDDADQPAPGIVAALRDLATAGVLLVPCTGRPLLGALRAAAALEAAPSAFVAYHGALVTDAATGRWLRHLSLPPGLAARLATQAVGDGLDVSLYVGDERVDLGRGDSPALPANGPGVTRLVLAGASLRVSTSMGLLGEARACGLRLEPVRPGVVVVLPGAADKGEGLRLAVAHLGADPARVVACGDTTNDVTLLRTAAHGIAVGDAPPELRRVAGLTVPQDGLAEALRDAFARLS